MSQNPDPQDVARAIDAALAASVGEFHDDRPPYCSPLPSDARFDHDLAAAARAEGLSEAAVSALLVACHSRDARIALDAYRDSWSGRWKVCPSEIPHWSTRPDGYEPRMWLSEWAAQEGL